MRVFFDPHIYAASRPPEVHVFPRESEMEYTTFTLNKFLIMTCLTLSQPFHKYFRTPSLKPLCPFANPRVTVIKGGTEGSAPHIPSQAAVENAPSNFSPLPSSHESLPNSLFLLLYALFPYKTRKQPAFANKRGPGGVGLPLGRERREQLSDAILE